MSERITVARPYGIDWDPEIRIRPLDIRATRSDWEMLRDWWDSDVYKRGERIIRSHGVYTRIQSERSRQIELWVARGRM